MVKRVLLKPHLNLDPCQALSHVPEIGDIILPVVLGSTVIFELTGPVLTRYVLIRVGEVKQYYLLK